jgi:hypothetical protein
VSSRFFCCKYICLFCQQQFTPSVGHHGLPPSDSSRTGPSDKRSGKRKEPRVLKKQPMHGPGQVSSQPGPTVAISSRRRTIPRGPLIVWRSCRCCREVWWLDRRDARAGLRPCTCEEVFPLSLVFNEAGPGPRAMGRHTHRRAGHHRISNAILLKSIIFNQNG